MQIIEKNVNDLIPYANNPRKNSKAVPAVKESIRQFGMKVPIVIDKEGVVVCGHTRLKACKQLKMKTVPCVIADDLDEEQIKAFRLADNKVSEQAEWDLGLLSKEMDGIFNIDMQDFGFEKLEMADIFPEEEPATERKNEDERFIDQWKLEKIDFDRLTSKWQMPIIKKVDHVPSELISFHYAINTDEFSSGIHFYIEDYKFERLWNDTAKYFDRISKFDCILTPDFSLYTDMPLPEQIYNVFRSKLIGQILQDKGFIVIPTLQWCRPDSYEFCFDGIEPGGTVSVSTVGVKNDIEALGIWFDGMDEAMKVLKPKTVIVYGGDIGYDFKDAKVVYIENHSSSNERIEKARERKKDGKQGTE